MARVCGIRLSMRKENITGLKQEDREKTINAQNSKLLVRNGTKKNDFLALHAFPPRSPAVETTWEVISTYNDTRIWPKFKVADGFYFHCVNPQ